MLGFGLKKKNKIRLLIEKNLELNIFCFELDLNFIFCIQSSPVEVCFPPVAWPI
jgi:hypothetical protein